MQLFELPKPKSFFNHAMKLRILISLPNDNKYHREQAVVARSAATRLGIAIELLHADDDPITQSQQLLKVIQSAPESHPHAIIVAPISRAGLPRVAQAATAAGIGWVVTNSNVDYLSELRSVSAAPVFAVSQKQSEIGQTQGRQLAALLHSGTVLYMQGPSSSSTSIHRRLGMESSKPLNVDIRNLHSKLGEESAYQAAKSWLRLATSRAELFDLVAGQTHELALGARKAFDELKDCAQRERWLRLPFVGVGLAKQVEPLVDRGILTAAVTMSTTVDVALEMLNQAILSKMEVPACTFVSTFSYPSVESLSALRKK
jgi:ABC-type sugar transport system substrate-binding protein